MEQTIKICPLEKESRPFYLRNRCRKLFPLKKHMRKVHSQLKGKA